jgi:carboxyl-terminal processing protease
VHSGEKLSDDSVVIVTVGSLATPKGREIDRKGIKPDYVVEIPETMLKTWTPTNIATPKDPQYTQALAVLLQR